MTGSQPIRRLLAGAISLSLTASLVGLGGGATLAAQAEDGAAEPRTPQSHKKAKLTWWADPTESSAPDATLQPWSDITSVGVAVEKGESKLRKQLVKQGGKKDTSIGPKTKIGKKDRVVHVVANLAGPVPNKLAGNLVLVVGVNGDGAVPYTTSVRDAVTQGSAFAHVVGFYDAQGAWLTGDDSLKGDAPGGQIDFDRPGTGAGGYDRKSRSIYTSFKAPKQLESLQVSLYNTANGVRQTDLLAGPGHTYRVPVKPWVNPVTCATAEVYARRDAAGNPTGFYDVKATLQEPLNPEAPPNGEALALELVGPGSDGAQVEGLPSILPGSGVGYYHVVVEGSPDSRSTFGVTAPGESVWTDSVPGAPPAVANAFSGITLDAGPDSTGTAFGSSDCGKVTTIDGCAYGGGVDLLAGIAEANGSILPELELGEFPVLASPGPSYCVVADEASNGALMAFGVATRPYTLADFMRTMESNPYPKMPVDMGAAGFMSIAPDGTITYSWLEPGAVPWPSEDELWGFRFELTLLPETVQLLSLPTTIDNAPPLYQYSAEYARGLLGEAGWLDDQGAVDFGNDATHLDGLANGASTE